MPGGGRGVHGGVNSVLRTDPSEYLSPGADGQGQTINQLHLNLNTQERRGYVQASIGKGTVPTKRRDMFIYLSVVNIDSYNLYINREQVHTFIIKLF